MNRRMVIIGFMGCGKTTVARALADRLSCEMIDLDSFITEREGRSPAEIIQEDGEPAFRAIETRALEDALSVSNAAVIALGGGTWTVEANRELMTKDNCVSVWLDVPFEICWQRITSSGHSVRPLAPNRESAKELFELRRPLYALSSLKVVCNEPTRNPDSLVDDLCNLRGWHDYECTGNSD